MGARIPFDTEGDHYGHPRGEVDVGSSDMLGELYASFKVFIIFAKRQSLPCAYRKALRHSPSELC